MNRDDLENKLLQVQALVGELIEALAQDREPSPKSAEDRVKTSDSPDKRQIGEGRGAWRVA